MSATELGNAKWRKSSHSGLEECVEVAFLPERVAVRDSKDPHGPALIVPAAAFSQLLRRLA